MKKPLSLFLASIFAVGAYADVLVSDVLVRQLWPWSPTVNIDFCITGTGNSGYRISVATYSGANKLCDISPALLDGDTTVYCDGHKRISFNPTIIETLNTLDLVTDFTVRLTATADTGKILYKIIDLRKSAGAIGQTSYITDEALTNGLWGAWSDDYWPADGVTGPIWTAVTTDAKWATTHLVLRRIPSGTFMMGSPSTETGRTANRELLQKEVNITKDYYMAVFEFTQGQWYNLTGNWLTCSNSVERARRPIEGVSWAMLRGTYTESGGYYDWPLDRHIAENSIIGILRSRTGLSFDLPTEAQWEKACRAGTTGAIYSGEANSNATLIQPLGRIISNITSSGYPLGGTSWVGYYKPNGYGLYDMYGNVIEYVLDWFAGSTGYVADADPEGPDMPSGYGTLKGRQGKGGHGARDYTTCRSAARSPWDQNTEKSQWTGFRVCLPVE